MLGIGAATRVFLAAGATDMRKGFDGLFGLVRERLQEDPCSGHVFGFANRERTRVKLLYWDGSGLWVCAKRLERGRFRWPEAGQGASRHCSGAELAGLLEGLEVGAARRRGWYRREAEEKRRSG